MGKNKKHYSLEREVIFSVVILYTLICGSMLTVHYMQPKDQATVTSSSSPAHDHFDNNKKEIKKVKAK